MATNTPNYNLEKPAQTDFYDVDVQNANMDKIDTALNNKVDKVTGKGLSTNDYTATDKSKVNNVPSNTNLELEGKTDNTDFETHTGNTTVHTNAAEKAAWNNKMPKATSPVAGNLAEFNADGTVKDSGKSVDDFASSEHEADTVETVDGVHGIRYYNDKLQVKDGDDWKVASGGIGIQVVVSVATGSAVTATDGTTTLTGTSVNNAITFDIPNYGSWAFSATLNGQTSNTVTLAIDAAKLFNVTLTYFSATIVVTAKSGSVVTLTKGSLTQTKTSTGTASFTVNEAGTYSASAVYENVSSNTVSVAATTSGSTYNTSVTFITLTVTVDSGSTVIATKESSTYTKVSTGTAVFYLPSTGTWAVTASLSGDTTSGSISISTYGAYALTLNYFKIFGVNIDLTNSDPATAVTYTDDAVGMTAGSSAWDSEVIFKDIKPCVLLNGVVQYYLNPNDFTKKADGTVADITSGNAGDVMIEIPKTGFKIATSGNTLTIKVTDNPNAGSDGFKYYAHTRSTEGDREKLYIGAYLGYSASNKLRSLSGKTPYAGETAPAGTIGTCRTLTQANGTGYDQVSFFPLTLLQCLFLIKYKNRDSQTALGRGYVDGNSASIATGGTNTKGMFFGETTGKQQMKFLGIEDMWGNLRWWIDGLFSDASRNILTAFDNFNDTGSGYTSRGQGATTNIGNYMSKPQGSSETGFIAKEVSASATTHFTDYASLNASRLPYFGGDWDSGDSAGVFYLFVSSPALNSLAYLGGRLMYL